jgi:TatD DNase family protein
MEFSTVDAHFHPEKLESKLHQPLQNHHIGVDLALSCFAFPESWPNHGQAPISLPSSAMFYQLGWHPTRTHTFSHSSWIQFQQESMEENAVALGEVGIDLFRRPETLKSQRDLLCTILPFISQLKKPLVLHMRDRPKKAEALDTTLQLCSYYLDRDFPILLHCFNYGIHSYLKWIQKFPNLLVSISPLVNAPSHHPELHDLISCLDLERIVLESDSPYLGVGPKVIHEVAATVATIKGIPPEFIIHSCTKNIQKMFFSTDTPPTLFSLPSRIK